MLTREQILAGRDRLRRQRVDVPELGGEVLVWELTARDRDSHDRDLVLGRNNGSAYDNFRARLLVRALRDEGGERLFADDEVDLVGQLPSTVIAELWEVASRLSLITAQDVADLRKNSSGEPNGGSRSGSPSVSG